MIGFNSFLKKSNTTSVYYTIILWVIAVIAGAALLFITMFEAYALSIVVFMCKLTFFVFLHKLVMFCLSVTILTVYIDEE